ncbi:MAG: preprotein translocase subunit SecY [bacterium]|nr:preprotein translocase subunit SecY [bacterium]
MFATFKQIFRSSNKDLRVRILFTLCVLFIFALGNAITIPGMNVITGDIGFLELFNAMSGGGLKQFSIFALGVMPYITASIIIQILQMDIIPYFKELKEMGEEGRRKIARITRYAGLAIAFIQGFFYPMMFLGKTLEPIFYFKIALILTAGTAFLLYLGDEITNKGIGNGVSLIIMAGIVNTLPSMFVDVFNSLIPNASNALIAWLSFGLFILLYLGIIVGVIFVQEAERRIPIQYSNRSSSSYGGQQTFLPLRLNSAGVMPVIIASVIMGIPSIISYFTKNESVLNVINNYLSTSKPVGFIIYIVLIIAFTFIYTFLTINPEELSKNLNKNGGYIPGIRPGKETKKYISKVLVRITFLGAIFISIIAALPTIFTAISGLSSSIRLGGTSILIAVGVVLETYKQLESSVASRNYNNRR